MWTIEKGLMLAKNWLFLTIAATLTLVCSCAACKADTDFPLDWPQMVRDSLWLPQGSMIERHSHRLSYDVYHRISVCYPATALIDEMVTTMTERGWKRLDYDPVNPGTKVPLNHAMTPSPQWDAGLLQDFSEVYGWGEFFQDKNGNIAEYVLQYRLAKGQTIEKACTMTGVSSFIYRDDLQFLLRVFEKMPVIPPGQR